VAHRRCSGCCVGLEHVVSVRFGRLERGYTTMGIRKLVKVESVSKMILDRGETCRQPVPFNPLVPTF